MFNFSMGLKVFLILHIKNKVFISSVVIKIYSVKLKFGKILSLAPLNLSILVRIFSRESIITSAFDLVLIRKYKIRLGDGPKFDCYSTNFKINKG